MRPQGWLATAASALALVVVGCGESTDSDTPEAISTTTADSASPDVLFDRYDRIIATLDYDELEREVQELPAGDRGLYVLFTVDGEINNGGFSQYLLNGTATLHGEAVESARLIGATQTVRLLEQLPRALDLQKVPNTEAELEAVLDRLTAEQKAKLSQLDEAWYAGISDEIHDRLLVYLDNHPQAFSHP